jgi:general transcription factor 3C polypeptide 5 (transcription factor C subunit 1)
LYQLCDIIDPEISPIIHNPDYLKSTTASKYCGFYYQCVIERIRKAVRKKHISLMDTGKADSIPDVENGLMAEVAKERESKTTEVEEEEGYEVIMEGEEDIEEDDDGTIASSSTATKAAKGKGKAKAAPKNKEGAIKEAQKEMNKPDSSRRLKEVVDDYMDELVKGKSSGGNDFDEDVDLDALEEYDEEEFEDIEAEDEVAGKEEEYDQGEEEAVAEEAAEPEEEEEDDEIVKPEPMSDILQEEDIPQGEDVDMKDA